MGLIKSFAVFSLIVASVAILISLDCMKEYREIICGTALGKEISDFYLWGAIGVLGNIFHSSWSEEKNTRIFTKDELRAYDGSSGNEIYLAILGKVFDVSKGEKHYGKGQGYSFFAGKDGSRAYVTGEFNEKGLTEDVSGLSNTQILDLLNWVSFYEKEYTLIGLLEGHFYNKDGQPTEAMMEVNHAIEAGKEEKAAEQDDRKVFPPCNSEWSQSTGGRVWCSKKSGGIERDWVGVPRHYHKPGKSVRCACVKTTGPPHDEPSSHANRGDLDNPNLKLYRDCQAHHESCRLVD